jgi:hypothetical protein
MKKPLLIATSLGLALAVGGAWQAHRFKRERQQVLAAAVQQRAVLTEKIRGAEGRIATAERQRAELQATLDGLHAAQVAAAGPAAGKKSASTPTMPGMDELLAREPKLQALHLASQRANLATRYGSLLQALHLTPERTAQFADLMMKRAEQSMDLQGAIKTQPGADNERAAATLARQSEEEFQAAQTTLLGADGYEQLRQYERSLPVRSTVVDSLGEALARTATPLTNEQAERLTQTLAYASSQYQKGGIATQATIDWETVLAKAPGLLSAGQMEMLKATAAREQISRKTFSALRAAGLMR